MTPRGAHSSQIAARVISAIGTLSRSQVRRLVLLGLLVRLALSPLYGSQDMEWWKAWGSYAVTQGVTRVYGAPDEQILGAWREGKDFPEILRDTQAVIAFQPYRYFRTEYRVLQPPVYVYSLYVSTRLYQVVSPSLENGRLFNIFINLQPILASAVMAWLIAGFLTTVVSAEAGRLGGMLYWLNPLVILNSPVQAYQDPLCVLLATLSVMALHRRHLPHAVMYLALAALTKPQGILIAPIVVAVGLLEHRLSRNVGAWLVGAGTGVVVSLPYLLEGRLLSVVTGVWSIGQASTDISRQALNLWWPVQYAVNAVRALGTGDFSTFAVVAGGGTCWQCDVQASVFTSSLGFPVSWIGLGMLAAFTVANLLTVRKFVQQDRRVILTAAVLQVYAYFMLRVGVQVNHYFLLVPLLTLTLLPHSASIRLYAWICALFCLQDLIFYGLGRDLNVGVALLSRGSAGWITVAIASTNVATFAWLCIRYFRSGEFVIRESPIPRIA